jgi:hypothetical protein
MEGEGKDMVSETPPSNHFVSGGAARAGAWHLASAFTKSIGFEYKPGELYFKEGEKYVVCAGFYAGALARR